LPKRVLQIAAFEGGLNKRNDPRDIKGNELVEARNVDVSNLGRIVMPGEGRAIFNTVNSLNQFVSPSNDANSQSIFTNNVPISDGYGIFSFVHDYNFTNDDSLPQEIGTEFICINDGADIKAWRDNVPVGFASEFDKILSLGTVHSTAPPKESSSIEDEHTVKPIFYKADNGLRVCDANFSEAELSVIVDGSTAIASDATTSVIVSSATHSIVAKEYIKIDSEVMKVISTSGTTINVERGRFGSAIENHDASSKIYRLNVPKVFAHINRPMLKKSGANVNINRWVEDIQVPEAPKYGALTVFRSNILGVDTNTLTDNSLYPDEPEKVNLGISFSTVADNAMLALHTGEVLSSESTALETVLLITLADSDDPDTPVDVTSSTYNFAVGKFITISGAIDDLVNLNGIHEIVGFGGTGEVKISADLDLVGGTCTGDEQVILEDEIMDDNLKNKYVIGMSYVYDGGGSEVQESNITTGLAYASSLLGGSNTIPNVTNWRTIRGTSGGGNITANISDATCDTNSNTTVTMDDTSAISANMPVEGPGIPLGAKVASVTNGTTFVLSVAATATATNQTLVFGEGILPTDKSMQNQYQFLGHGNIRSAANGQYLFYENSNVSVETSTSYWVSGAIKFTKCTDVSVKLYVGLGPDRTAVSGFTPITVSQPSGSAASGLVEFAGTAVTDSSVDADVPIAIQVINAANGSGEQVRIISVDVRKKDTAPEVMSNTNAIDLRDVQDVAKGYLSFLCNNSRTGAYNATTPNNSWNERIEGFRIYMKQVDIIGGGLADDWTMLYDVNLKEGTYVMHAKDSDEETLRLGDISGSLWEAVPDTPSNDAKAVVTSNLSGDSIKTPPVLTYEALNGYKNDTNLAAMYKTSAVVQRKVYIGNLKIGNKRFPDRMIKSSADKFDIFPDDSTSFIDVATSDGENIVKLESFGEYLLQFKEKTTYLIKVTSEGEELISTWHSTGIMHPSQCAKTPGGVFWANSSGVFFFDGQQIKNVVTEKFGLENWSVGEDNQKPIILGYDNVSNKVLIITNNVSDTSNGGYIYDIDNNSMTQCQNLFSWYPASNTTDEVVAHQEPL